ncbi:glutamate--cysteine ligase [Pusillimonas sp. TS35]|uniref:glutamate--cysteine ligase n=1 Tax=Paracandidimonas lactea TaxID=2895524 RepID=UPI00136D0640|nr:glutamate--cysteine ligase [Paracandidimonas lactea]MYN14839.1 glutamate--cysteine ligase [Pusillimonas sp. TS35]
MTTRKPGYNALAGQADLIKGIKRGIEKEGLRVTLDGELARTPHPPALGAALTHPRITTDYSESLLELITAAHHSTESLISELEQTHRYVAATLRDELLWNQSMPALLPPDADIPIAWYGTSNTGMLKHVYRRGLAVRYGKTMQCIAGVHYNFSVPEAMWPLLGMQGDDKQRRSRGYLALIRNFTRYSWLLMYLFGASPALSSSFLHGMPAGALEKLDDTTLYLPHATSLRMSDMGYQSNRAQSELQLCYNDLETFLQRMYTAVTTPWPAYEAIGTHRNGEWIQLNTNIIQIENEYYSSIRPKRTTGRCERPVTALAERGVEYVEVRCLDIDPYSPTGISVQTAHFMDAFLLFCAAESSADFPNNGFCTNSRHNFSRVAKEGRKPGLKLNDEGTPIALADWGRDLLERILPYAELLDAAHGGNAYRQALAAQQPKLDDTENTPSATLLRDIHDSKLGLVGFTLQQSFAHRDAMRAASLDATTLRSYQMMADDSIAAQKQLEDSDTESFDTYVERYHAALRRP